jgi:hypothetical protein
MICFFSVLTHLLHEQSYWYLEEAKRVLKPSRKVVFSFLEFIESSHWQVFMTTVNEERAGGIHPLNVFLDRQCIAIWARHLGLKVEHLRGALDPIPWENLWGNPSACYRSPKDISGGGPSE